MTSYRGSHFERKEIIFAVKTNITNQLLEVMLAFMPRHNEPNEQLTEKILSGSIWEKISCLHFLFCGKTFVAAVKCPVLTNRL